MKRLLTRGKLRGQSMIEFALVLPLFLILIGGVVDFGIFMFQREQAASCVRTVARMIVVRSTDATSSPNWANLVPQCAKAVQKGETAFSAPAVTNVSPPGGAAIVVTVNYPYSPIFLSMAIPGLSQITTMQVTASVTMRMEAGSA